MGFQLIEDREGLVAELRGAGAPEVTARKSGFVIARKIERGFALNAVISSDGHREVRDGEVADTDTKWLLTRANADGTAYLNVDSTSNSWMVEEEVLRAKYECEDGGEDLVDGLYRPKGVPQSFIRCDRDISLMQPWGEGGALVTQDMPRGSWLNITNGPGRMYGVCPEEFAETYEIIDG